MQTSSDDPLLTAGSRPRGLGLNTLPKRFLLVYPVVFMLPFPLTLLWQLYSIPHFSESFLATPVGWLLGLHQQATQPIVAWLGRLLTGQTPSFAPTGSGDGLASYLGALLNFCLAVVVTLIWWFRHRAQPISPRVADVCRVLLRYFLAWVMLSYGFSKSFRLNFPRWGRIACSNPTATPRPWACSGRSWEPAPVIRCSPAPPRWLEPSCSSSDAHLARRAHPRGRDDECLRHERILRRAGEAVLLPLSSLCRFSRHSRCASADRILRHQHTRRRARLASFLA